MFKATLYNVFKNTDLNKFAKDSLSLENDSGKVSWDEAYSIHVTSSLWRCKWIAFEGNIRTLHGVGKPDYILGMTGNNVLVSVTRAFRYGKSKTKNTFSNVFDKKEATRLLTKKIKKLMQSLEKATFFVETSVKNYSSTRPCKTGGKYNPSDVSKGVLHVEVPTLENLRICNEVIGEIRIPDNIKIMITLIEEDIYK